MAGRSSRKKVQIVECPQTQRSYQDLSRYEVARVNSALSAAANFGKNPNTKIQKGTDSYSSQHNEESATELNTKSSKNENSNSSTFTSQSDTESDSESLENENSDWFTLTINRTGRHRLEKALKLLEFVEGVGSDHDSDYSLTSVSSSLILDNESIKSQTSTPRVQALQDEAYRNY